MFLRLNDSKLSRNSEENRTEYIDSSINLQTVSIYVIDYQNLPK
jgi:hypothetical protein